MTSTPSSREPAPDGAPAAPRDTIWKTLALTTLPLLGIALIVLAIVLLRPARQVVVTEVLPPETGAAINLGQIIDATVPGNTAVPRLGFRYRLFVEDESDDRSSGIARMGGRTVFIQDARRGQTVLADVTRVRDRVVDATLAAVLGTVELPPKPPRAAWAPAPGDPTADIVAGAVLDVVLTEPSSKNPENEAIARVAGLVVVVQGAPSASLGERVNVRITDRRERIAFAELTGAPAGTDPLPVREARPANPAYRPEPGDPAVIGAEFDVVISEPSAKRPGEEGIAKIGGLVIAVKGATTVGERVNVRITDRRERIAFAEPTGKPAGDGPLPEMKKSPRPPKTKSPAIGAGAAAVAEGAVLDLDIIEPSRKNPTTEGVAKVEGLVIFVSGATEPGSRVKARITSRMSRVAFAESLGPADAPAPQQ
jgi:predicted RNA-binding protein with TRAM domain